jgi:hypothetical protein
LQFAFVLDVALLELTQVARFSGHLRQLVLETTGLDTPFLNLSVLSIHEILQSFDFTLQLASFSIEPQRNFPYFSIELGSALHIKATSQFLKLFDPGTIKRLKSCPPGADFTPEA